MAEPTTDISTQIQESLKDTPYACKTLTKLSGGTANFVFRGILAVPLADGSKTVVAKHTPPYVASNPGFKLTDERCVCLSFNCISSVGENLHLSRSMRRRYYPLYTVYRHPYTAVSKCRHLSFMSFSLKHIPKSTPTFQLPHQRISKLIVSPTATHSLNRNL